MDVIGLRDGDPDSGLIVLDIEPAHADPLNASGVLVRQPASDAPYEYGWPGLAWTPEDDPETPVSAHQWDDGPWRWIIFVTGAALSDADVARIRDSIEWQELS